MQEEKCIQDACLPLANIENTIRSLELASQRCSCRVTRQGCQC
jgi:hypothetical protein